MKANQLEISNFIQSIRRILEPEQEFAQRLNSVVPDAAAQNYIKIYERISGCSFGSLIEPKSYNLYYNPTTLIKKVVEISGTESTLKMYARSIRYVHFYALKNLVLNNENKLEKLFALFSKGEAQQYFQTILSLAECLPYQYKVLWTQQKVNNYVEVLKLKNELQDDEKELTKAAEDKFKKSRKKPHSKKYSLGGLPADWPMQLAASFNFKSQFTIPAIICLITGCRPSELQHGAEVLMNDGTLTIKIIGSKVTEHAGQPFRTFKLAENELTKILKHVYLQSNQQNLLIKVAHGNSVTQFIRRAAKKMWPQKKIAVSCYSARHNLIKNCKEAKYRALVGNNFPSKIAGHRATKTITNYAKRRSSKSKKDPSQKLSDSQLLNLIPRHVEIPIPIKDVSRVYPKERFKKSSKLIR